MELLTLEHLLITSDQPRRLQQFYEDVFGHCVTWSSSNEADPDWIHLTGGRSYLSLCRRRADPPQPAGFMHMGWVVDDLPAFRARLAEHGVNIHRDLTTREGNHAYIYDPDRHELELVHYHPGFFSPKNAASVLERMNHVRLTVSDLDASVAFYTQVLGFTCTPVAGSEKVHLSSGDSYVSLSPVNAEHRDGSPTELAAPRFLHAGWVASDLKACRQRLAGQRVQASRRENEDQEHLYFPDPDADPNEVPNVELAGK